MDPTARRRRTVLIAAITGGLILLLLIGVGVYGLIRGPQTTEPADPTPTDGPTATQQAKVRALGLDTLLGFIVCTGSLGPGRGKPHPLAFERVETWAAPHGLPLVYVADNPLKDFVAPPPEKKNPPL